MITLNLTANGNAEQKIKDYLEQNGFYQSGTCYVADLINFI